ncbi:MAG: type VII toxin-antitoxin system MntA family adenylyltransferase antitoxin [Desulfotignum sp.]
MCILYFCGIAAVYLFGSAATGKMKADSDLDIAVMSAGRIDGFERISMETALSNLLGRDVDLVIFHQAGVLLQHQILKYGCLIFMILQG